MLEVTFAYIVATAVLLSFKSTRWVGAVALFVFLTASPVLGSVLLIMAALGYHYVAKRQRRGTPKRLPRDD
jgi:hypothetical protein